MEKSIDWSTGSQQSILSESEDPVVFVRYVFLHAYTRSLLPSDGERAHHHHGSECRLSFFFFFFFANFYMWVEGSWRPTSGPYNFFYFFFFFVCVLNGVRYLGALLVGALSSVNT